MSGDLGGTLALTRLGGFLVGVEGHLVSAFFEPGERSADCDLAALLSLPAPHGGPIRLLEIEHGRGRFVMAVHGRVRIAAGERQPHCERPRLVDGVFRRACLRGVMRHESEIVYLLDVEEVASRIGREMRGPQSVGEEVGAARAARLGVPPATSREEDWGKQ